MWEKHLKKKEILRKGPASSSKISLWDSFQFLLEQTWFLSMQNIDSKWVIPNKEWVKKINGLLQMAPLTITWCIVPFKNRKSWAFCYLLKLAISYFSDMWTFRDLPLHKRRIYPTLTNFSVLTFLPIQIPKSVHVWPQLDNEVSTWFP